MLWVDKYRPTQLDKLDFHDDLTDQLRRMASKESVNRMSHLLFYGPSGAGKKTRVMALLREIYGPGVEKLKIDVRPFKFKSSTVEITFISSNYHLEMNPSDVGPYRDRDVAQEVIKEIAQSHAPSNSSNAGFKVVLLNEVDKMSRDGQAALRRTMEKYTAACRFILVCNNACKVIEPLRSRCVCLRVPAPTVAQVSGVLEKIYKKEGGKMGLPKDVQERVAAASGRNLRKAILMIEAMHVKSGHQISEGAAPQHADWEIMVTIISDNILQEQSPKMLMTVRGQLYDLLACCIPAEMIIRRLAVELLKKMDDSMKPMILQQAAFFEHRMQLGSKPIFHLEAFIAKVMAQYKKWTIEFMELCAAMDE